MNSRHPNFTPGICYWVKPRKLVLTAHVMQAHEMEVAAYVRRLFLVDDTKEVSIVGIGLPTYAIEKAKEINTWRNFNELHTISCLTFCSRALILVEIK